MPQATISQPTASSPEIQQVREQVNQNRTAMTRAQAIRANQALGIEVRDHFGHFAPSRHEVPRWNQRKARKLARQTGRKVQKRYKR